MGGTTQIVGSGNIKRRVTTQLTKKNHQSSSKGAGHHSGRSLAPTSKITASGKW